MTLTHDVDATRFRTTLGHYPTGVALVTAIDEDGEPVGMVVGSFTSVSLDPPLVAFLPTRTSGRFARLRTASSFCVNVLAADQGDLCRAFATKGADGFPGVTWTPSPSGAPVVDGVVAWIDCTFDSVTEGGDHLIVLGRVRDLDVVRPIAPLLFFQGGYGRFAPLSLVAPSTSDLVAGVRLAELIRRDVEELATDLRAEVTVFAAAGGDLAVVAAALGPGAEPETTLGTRVPLRPPLGELYAAGEGSEGAEAWLDRAVPADPCSRERYAERLHAARERGWSMSLAEPAGPTLAEYLQEYTRGELTPARERELHDAIAQASARYEPLPLRAGERYDVGSLVAPVSGADGRVHLVLRLAQLPPDCSGAEVQRWVDRLLEAAAAATARVRAAG